MHRISRRGFVACSAGLVAAAAFSPGAKAQGSPIRIGVGSDPSFASFFVAAHEKLFEAEQVDAALQFYADGGETMNALVAGQVDLAAAGEPTSMLRLVRAELRPLAVVYESGTYVKLVLGSAVSEPTQIKRFGIVPGSISDYCARLAVKKYGLDAASIAFVPSGPPELPALLSRGDIDAFFAWEPWPSIAVQQGGHVAATSAEVGYLSTQWLTATAALLKDNPEGAKRVLRALAKACDIVRSDPERAATATATVTKIPRATSLKAFKDMTPLVRDYTDEDLASYDRIAQFLTDQKITPTNIPYRDSLQRGFVTTSPQ